MIKNRKPTLEKRIAKLEKLLSKKQTKNEGMFLDLLDNPKAASTFRNLRKGVLDALGSLRPLLSVAKQCDQLVGADSNKGDSCYYILRSAVADLGTVADQADLEAAVMDYDEDWDGDFDDLEARARL